MNLKKSIKGVPVYVWIGLIVLGGGIALYMRKRATEDAEEAAVVDTVDPYNGSTSAWGGGAIPEISSRDINDLISAIRDWQFNDDTDTPTPTPAPVTTVPPGLTPVGPAPIGQPVPGSPLPDGAMIPGPTYGAGQNVLPTAWVPDPVNNGAVQVYATPEGTPTGTLLTPTVAQPPGVTAMSPSDPMFGVGPSGERDFGMGKPKPPTNMDGYHYVQNNPDYGATPWLS